MEGPHDSTSASMEQGEGSHVCNMQQPAESLQVWDCALSPAAPYLPLAGGRAVRAMAMLRVRDLVKVYHFEPVLLVNLAMATSGKYDKITITKTIFN